MAIIILLLHIPEAINFISAFSVQIGVDCIERQKDSAITLNACAHG